VIVIILTNTWKEITVRRKVGSSAGVIRLQSCHPNPQV
jgi:hypothetical protein